MKRIIYVPGKNPKPPEDKHREQLLRCLLHGVSGVDTGVADEIRHSDRFTIVGWNRVFYNEVRDIEEIAPWVDRLLASSHPDTDPHPRKYLRKYRLARIMYQLGDAFPAIIPLIPDRRIKSSIQDTERYFANHDNIACKVRYVLKQILKKSAEAGEQVLLIAHSMGSVISWDSLYELHHLEAMDNCVDQLLTIGSPLGMNYVQRRLLGLNSNHPHPYPGNIREWDNVSARGDLVALDPSLENDFKSMIADGYVENINDYKVGIYNHYRDAKGLNVHKSYGYLVNPVVSKLVADWWRRT